MVLFNMDSQSEILGKTWPALPELSSAWSVNIELKK
jgi:hypothetical protein